MNFKVDYLSKNYKSILHVLLVLSFFCILYTLFFSPILFFNKLLAPGDAIVQSLPAFYSPRTLWTPLLLSGFPVAADPTPQTWYPISLLFSVIPNSWNAFVVSAYVLASSFSYGYVYTLTESRLAAVVGGIIYGMSGFMMAHLGHTSMIHTAVWMPLLIWALEKLRHNISFSWLTVGVFAVACSCLAGHPQIFVYGIGLSGAYALVLGGSESVQRWKYYKSYLAVVVLGVALAALQLIPTMELAKLGLRSEMSFNDFVSYSLPLQQAIILVFPFLFGGYFLTDSFYKLPYIGEWNLTELTGYIGLLPLILAIIGFLTYENKSIKRFWFTFGLLTFLLALGEATPLAQLMYHLPAYKRFRVPARHLVEMALAVSVLAGLGVATLQKQLASNHLRLKIVLVSTGMLIISIIGLFLTSNHLKKKAIDAGIEQFTLLPWLNPAVGVPLVILGLSITTLILWSQSTQSKFRGLALVIVLCLDLASFGWFYEWRYFAPSKDVPAPPASIQRYKEVLNSSHQRMLPLKGVASTVEAMPPNISRLWGVPSASGYGPLILTRYSQLLSMIPEGSVSDSVLYGFDKSLDITSTRYIFLPQSVAESILSIRNHESSELAENLNITLGSGCGLQRLNSIELSVPQQVKTTAIATVSSLGCSANIPDNAEVLRILVTDTNGKTVTQSLRAGRDTSEWAYSCSDVLPSMQHKQAPIFKSFPVVRESLPPCEGHRYQSILPLEKLGNVQNVKLEWIGSSGAISIHKVNLIDDESKQTYSIAEASSLRTGKTRWSHVEDINGISVYENLNAMPRAWMVSEIIRAKPDEILNYIKSSQLPDGRYYDPLKVAFIEERFQFKSLDADPSASAKIVNFSDNKVEIKTTSSTPAFLVLSDIDYPGWKATVDGKNTRHFRTNYLLRGVPVSSGEHVVKFEFKPLSFHLGLGISAASLAGLGYLGFKLNQQRKFISDGQ